MRLVGERLDGDDAGVAAAGALALEPGVDLGRVAHGEVGGLDVRPGEVLVAALAVAVAFALAVAGVRGGHGAARA